MVTRCGGIMHATKMKSRKFYKYVFNIVVGVSLTNALILFRELHQDDKYPLKMFHEQLATELIGDGIL